MVMISGAKTVTRGPKVAREAIFVARGVQK